MTSKAQERCLSPRRNLNAGFTLLEALIALVVLGVGMVGIMQFQSTLIGSVKESDLRSTAMSIAEREMEGLRNFETVSPGFYSIPASSISSVALTLGQGSYQFDISTAVETYNSSGVSVAADSTSAAYKEALVTVTFDSGKTVELSSIIAKIDPRISGYLGDDGNGGTTSKPTVSYTAGASPDVIKIDIDENGTQRETSKPVPELDRSGQNYESTVLKFETVTYNSDGRLVTEDFVTTNCLCEIAADAGSGQGYPPARTVLNDDGSDYTVDIPSAMVPKVQGAVSSDDSGQSYLCDRCCRDHHDDSGTASELNYRWYWPDTISSQDMFWGPGHTLAGDHKHFLMTGTPSSPSSVAATSVGDKYNENCRFKRVNGLYRLMQDWKLADISLFPRDYFTDVASGAENLQTYQNYVVSFAQESVSAAYHSAAGTLGSGVINLGAKSALFPTRDLTSTALGAISDGDTRQLLSRSIYLDPLTSDAVASIQSKIEADPQEDWLHLVPFYEINTTLLANWDPATGGSVANVSNEALSEIFDPANDYYGTYSRGRITTVSGGVTSITVSSFDSNTGLVGHVGREEQGGSYSDRIVWTDGLYDSNVSYIYSDSIQVEVTSAVNYLSGTFECSAVKASNGNEENCKLTGQAEDLPAFSQEINDMTISATGASCSTSIDSIGYVWRCNFGANPVDQNITFNASGASVSLYSDDSTNFTSYPGTTGNLSVSAASSSVVIIVLP